jgi:hypothetical protein
MVCVASGWNKRQVDFTKIHGDDSAAFAALLDHMRLRNGLVIGDLMGGYGAVSRNILERCIRDGIDIEIILSDAYKEQLERSFETLAPYDAQGFLIKRILEDARTLSERPSLDNAVIKFGLHEVRREEQSAIIQGTYRRLKENGEFYLWMPMGTTPLLNKHFQDVVRKKDELAGLDELVMNRYFSHENEIRPLLEQAGFRNIRTIYEGPFIYTTKNFLDSDFEGDIHKVEAWNDYLRSSLSSDVKNLLAFTDNGDSISLSFVKRIIKAEK